MNLRTFTSRGVLFGAAIALSLLFSLPARADLVVSVGSVTAAPGTTGDAIDVNLTNTGTSAVTLGGFSFGVSVADSDITFTEANISTLLPYLFAGDSLLGPSISFPPPVGSSLTASDIDAGGLGVTLGAGAEVGLGHLLFDVSPTASTGAFAVSFASWPTTSLSDAVGNDVPINALVDGQIQIAQVQAVPEPSPVIFVTGITLLMLISLRKGLGTTNH